MKMKNFKLYLSKSNRSYLLFTCLFFTSIIHVFGQNPLTPAKNFNLFLQGNANLSTNEVDGPVAIGGDLIVAGLYQVNTQGANFSNLYTYGGNKIGLAIRGGVNYSSGTIQVNSNSFAVIGNCNAPNSSIPISNGTTQINASGNLGATPNILVNTSQPTNSVCQNVFGSGADQIDIDAAFTSFKQCSPSIATKTNNVNIGDQNGNSIPGLVVDGSGYYSNTSLAQSNPKIILDPNIVNVLNVTDAFWAALGGNINFQGVPSSGSGGFILNIKSGGTVNFNMPTTGGTNGPTAPYTIFNFPDATTLNISGAELNATVFAPFANITHSGLSNIQGQVIGQSYTSSGEEIHHYPFAVDLGSCGSAPPTCNLSASASGTNPSCNGGTNGTVTLSVSGSNGTPTYSWSNGTTSKDLTGVGAGTYSVTVTNGSCTTTASVNITQPSAIDVTCSKIDVTTNGGSDGTATVMPNGGTSPYTYLWSNGQTTLSISGLISGTYSVTVTDANGCTNSCTSKVDQPAVVVCNLTASIPFLGFICTNSGGSGVTLTVNQTGGTGPYTYNWSVSNLYVTAPGNYKVTITDGNGCTAVDNINVQANTLSAVLTQTACTSIGIPVTLAVSGSAGHTWTVKLKPALGKGPDVVVGTGSNNTAFSYEIPFSATNGAPDYTGAGLWIFWDDDMFCPTDYFSMPCCSLSASAIGTNPKCNLGKDGTVTLSVSGANGTPTYSWSNGATSKDLTGVGAGTYSVTVTDGICTVTANVTISEPTPLAIVCSKIDVTTNGGSDGTATVMPNGGTSLYSYIWSNGQTTSSISSLISGTYVVSVTDANGCMSICSSVVNQPPPLVVCDLADAGLSTYIDQKGTATTSDDDYVVSANPTGTGLATTYNVTGDISKNNVPYGTKTEIGRFPISTVTVNIILTDDGTNTCSVAESAYNLNAKTCLVQVNPTVLCNDNGTPTISGDDTYSISINPLGNGLTSTYNVSGDLTVNNLPYGSAQQIATGLPISGGGKSINVIDAIKVDCKLLNIQIVPPAVCSSNCIPPTIGTNTPTEGTCAGSTANDDAQIVFVGFTNADKADKVEGPTFTGGSTYSAANLIVTSGGLTVSGLKHNTTYTFRFWNATESCFVDVTTTAPSKNCTIPCPIKICTTVKVARN